MTYASNVDEVAVGVDVVESVCPCLGDGIHRWLSVNDDLPR